MERFKELNCPDTYNYAIQTQSEVKRAVGIRGRGCVLGGQDRGPEATPQVEGPRKATEGREGARRQGAARRGSPESHVL